jgi:3-oxoacyl-[acyl-carrier-protein] synthase II
VQPVLRVNQEPTNSTHSGHAVAIRGLGMLSTLGNGVEYHRLPAAAEGSWLRPLGLLLGRESPYASLLAGWIEPRSLLVHRKWAPISMAALEVARQAIDAAGWDQDTCRESALLVATSRGSAAGWLAPFSGRRPFPMMAASNSMHAEPATAVGIEFGIRGPCHVLATGCSAGLDAAGLAAWLITTGVAPRALVISVDLPLAPPLLDAYAASGILSDNNVNDPYSAQSSGMLPAEAAVAMALDPATTGNSPRILAHHSNSDAWRPTGVPPDGGMLASLVGTMVEKTGTPAAICPHASGTAALAGSEPAALRQVFAEPPPLFIIKPLIGHAVAAGGLLEAAMVAEHLNDTILPASPAGLTPPKGLPILQRPMKITGPVLKLASGLGGHNSAIAIAPSA